MQRHLFTLILSLTFSCLLQADETTPGIALSGIAAQVRSSHPALAAARERIGEAQGRHRQSGRRANPTLETELWHRYDFGEGGIGLAFSQAFPITDRLRLEKEVTRIEIEAAEAEVRDAERRLIAEALEQAVTVLAAQQQAALLTQQQAVAEELASFVAGVAAKAEGSTLDATQAALEAAQLQLARKQLQVEEVTALHVLKPLLGWPADEALTVAGTLPELAPTALTTPDPHQQRPDFQAAQLAAKAAARELDLEKSKRWEDFEAGVFVEADRTEDAPEGLENDAAIGVRLTIPLPWWNKNKGAIDEKRAKHRRLEKEALALAAAIQHEAAAALAVMQQQAQLMTLTSQELLPQARQQVAALEAAYKQGQGDLPAILRARHQQLDLEASHLDALRDYHLARIRYEAAIGKQS